MVSPRAAALLALLALSCERPRPSATPQAPPREEPPSAAVTDAGRPPTEPSPAAAPWRWSPMARVDLRGADREGTVWSVVGETLLDETHEHATALPQELPCPLGGHYAMEFGPSGVGYLVVNGRFYVRPGAHLGWVVTPLCTDLQGAPWSYRREGGWALVAHTNPAAGPSMLLTQEPVGGHGWYAITAMDRTIRAAILEDDRTTLSLVNGGHLILVDQASVVAGEVLAGHGALFQGLSRTEAGVVAWRDEGPRRVLLTAPRVREAFTEVSGLAATPGPTRAVFRVDLARLLAVTPQGLERSDDQGLTWERALEGTLERPTFGYLPGRVPAVLCRDGVATPGGHRR